MNARLAQTLNSISIGKLRRLGIVVSCLWMVIVGTYFAYDTWTFASANAVEVSGYCRDDQTRIRDLELRAKQGDYTSELLYDFSDKRPRDCRLEGSLAFEEVIATALPSALLWTFLPVPLLWLLALASMRIGRWVLAG